MPLSALLAGWCVVPPERDVAIHDLALHSSDVTPGGCFVALAGEKDNGWRYARDAVARGARAVLTAEQGRLLADVPTIEVPALRTRLGELAARFYDAPSAAMDVVAVTGTNGKTSVAYLLAQASSTDAHGSGYIGTLGAGEPPCLTALTNTTPDVVTLNRHLARMRDQGCAVVALEASSHALAQDRLAGIQIAIAAFTNLGHDHLDYHGDLANYAAAKQRLFARAELRHAVINVDDEVGTRIASALSPRVMQWTCSSRGAKARVTATNIEADARGVCFELELDGARRTLQVPLIGRFNVDNLLLVIACLRALGRSVDEIVQRIADLATVPGRGEACGVTAAGARVFVDYAHTPESLAAILSDLRAFTRHNLWLVFGCGGDRDRAKRPRMGAVAEAGADIVIVTSDNPRSESPAEIASAILAGMSEPHRARIIEDRAHAIAAAVRAAGAGDTVLIAGKGHEATQDCAGVRRPFSDVAEVVRLIGGRTA
jgi:UDP-N-acetylmuramoyl-L-alanyl-D-glutamate--2,6-diaminopimelate ligase